MTPAQFIMSIDGIVKSEVEETVRLATQKISLEGLKGVVLKSPVGNPSLWKGRAPPGYVGGRFRGNWNVGIGSMDESVSNNTANNRVSVGASEINSADAYSIIWITNNLPYANRLENGWSKQAPGGMVALTFAELQAMRI
jgi:hypothetical protein